MLFRSGLGHPGLFVRVYDPDTVSPSNVGRQLFSTAEIGQNKARCIVSRINSFMGTDWAAEPRRYPGSARDATRDDMANIFLTCTDNVQSRRKLSTLLTAAAKAMHGSYTDHHTPLYWLDWGNARFTGQVILGTIGQGIAQPKSEMHETVASLPVVTDLEGYAEVKDEDSGPSCSLAEALTEQDLFVNSVLATHGCHLLWKLMQSAVIYHRGCYVNLQSDRIAAIPV